MKKLRYLMPACLLFILSNCVPLILVAAGAGAGAGVIGLKYYEGQVVAVYQAPFIDTWDATEKVLISMQTQSLTQKHDETAGKFEGTLMDARPVRVALFYKNSQETEVRIRVTAFGNEKASLEIQEKIRKELFEG